MPKKIQPAPEQWAIVKLMGHAQVIGKVELDSHLVSVEVADPYGGEPTIHHYGYSAIFDIQFITPEKATEYLRPALPQSVKVWPDDDDNDEPETDRGSADDDIDGVPF